MTSDKEAGKPAAPSVEQDERGAFIEAYMEARAASVAQAGAVFDNDWPAKQMWSAGIAYARAASTSANVAQDSKPITDLATIVKAAYGNKAWISRRDDIPDFLSPTSADYADLKAEGEKTSSWHPDFVVAMYENSRPDKLYTMDQMREYADAFHRSRVDAANVAQGAEPSAYRTLLDSLGYPWLPCPICNGTEGCDHSYPERARAALAAPPAQTALADAQVEAALAAFNAFPCPNPGSISRSWNADQMRSAIDAALTAAQSASGDTR